MKIAHVNYSDIGGGAARAAYRLHKGLLLLGLQSVMIVCKKMTEDKLVVHPDIPTVYDKKKKALFGSIQNHINVSRTDVSNTIFSFNYPGIDISGVPDISQADIINLHWIAGSYQSPVTLQKLFTLGKPVVWTLHDEWPFTGGCHYSAGCENYRNKCESCPQLIDNLYELPSKILLDKVDFFKGANLTIVSPSRWLRSAAEKSTLFGGLRSEVIPNAIETDIFRPLDKAEAKKRSGVSPQSSTILFVAENGREKRKGYYELLKALEWCRTVSRFDALIAKNKLTLLVLGNPGDELIDTGIPIHSFGYVRSDEKLREIYSAADIFVLPSLEDNLPNTMLEAMGCNTPVVAFDVGGMPDVIRNDMTGKIVPLKDTTALGRAILDLVVDAEKAEEMAHNCRKTIVDNFRLDVQAERYSRVYSDLLHRQMKMPVSMNLNEMPQEISHLGCKVDTATGRHFRSIEDQIKRKLKRSLFQKLAGGIKFFCGEVMKFAVARLR